MFVVKFKYKDSTEVYYRAPYITASKNEIKIGLHSYSSVILKTKKLAREIFDDLISKNTANNVDYSGWHNDRTLEYVSITELSHYPPHSEYQVIEYREFK